MDDEGNDMADETRGNAVTIRMKRIVFSIPESMRVCFVEIVRCDGRSQGEVLRSLVSQLIREFKAASGKSMTHRR